MLVWQSAHAWVVVDPLIRLHFLNPIQIYCCICPIKVPVHSIILYKPKIQLFTSFLDDSVFALGCAKYQFWPIRSPLLTNIQIWLIYQIILKRFHLVFGCVLWFSFVSIAFWFPLFQLTFSKYVSAVVCFNSIVIDIQFWFRTTLKIVNIGFSFGSFVGGFVFAFFYYIFF